MKRLKLSVLLLAVAIGTAAVGSAALSSLVFERKVSAGQVLLDTDPNVAVQITNISSYPGLIKTEADGQVSFHLNEGISYNSSSGFNTDALYSIGSASAGVVKIKNNSDVPISVVLTNNESNSGAISLVPVSESSSTIDVGSYSDFYFSLNTFGQDAVKELGATISIRGN